MTSDERRSARLLFDPELALGRLGVASIEHPDVARAVRSRRVPPRPVRRAQQAALRWGDLDHARTVERMSRARRSVLGEEAARPPRVLVRVDEFPHARALDEPVRFGRRAFERFHSVLREANVPYLLAVLPRVARDYLNPAGTGGRGLDDREAELLGRLRGEGVEIALHGWNHRTRRASARRRSELAGLDGPDLAHLLDAGIGALAAAGCAPRAFVPPFNRFAASQYPLLAERFDVVCGGPETVGEMGFHHSPLWRGDAVYAPTYPPLYDRAAAIDRALERLLPTATGGWITVVLHWGWEVEDGFEGVERLVSRLAPVAVDWSELFGAVERSR